MNIQHYAVYKQGSGVSIMAHIRRTRHIMMPLYRSYFSFAYFTYIKKNIVLL